MEKMASVDCAQMHVDNNTGAESERAMGLPHADDDSGASGSSDRVNKPMDEPLSSPAECELPEVPKTATRGQYFEFEQIANGIDGYFDGNSDTDDENFGENEDDSFSFDMCRVRRLRRSSKSPPEIYPRRRLENGKAMERVEADEIRSEVEEEGLDPEDVLCTVRENYTRAPPLAQEDDFDDLDV